MSHSNRHTSHLLLKNSVTVVLLAFNEGESLPALLDEMFLFFDAYKSKLRADVLIIDDGSTDNTREIILEYSQDFPVSIFSHPKNLGYGAALSSGLTNAKSDYVLIMDGDGQYDIFDLLSLFHEADLTDAVIVSGKRTNRADNILRRINGYLWTKFTNKTVGHPLSDVDCGFKLIKKSALQNLLPLKSTGAFAWTELLYLAARQGVVSEQPVRHRKRLNGTSTGNNPLVIYRALIEWFRFSIRLNDINLNSKKPNRALEVINRENQID